MAVSAGTKELARCIDTVNPRPIGPGAVKAWRRSEIANCLSYVGSSVLGFFEIQSAVGGALLRQTEDRPGDQTLEVLGGGLSGGR